jgi:hypothetical protein
VADWGIQLYAFFIFTVDVAKWLAAYRNHISPGKSPWYALYRRLGGPHSQSGHSRKEEISCPCQQTTRYPSAVQPVAHSIHPISYPALCKIVCVWQAEHMALEQPVSQLSSTTILVSLNRWRWMGRTEGGCLQTAAPFQQIFKFKKYKHSFCRHDAIKRLTWFTQLPNPTNENGWWLIH